MNRMILALAGVLAFGMAQAKLPAPSDEAKAKAEEAKAKTAYADKVAAFQLCKAQNRVVERYRSDKGVKGAALPACEDPGPFQATAASARK